MSVCVCVCLCVSVFVWTCVLLSFFWERFGLGVFVSDCFARGMSVRKLSGSCETGYEISFQSTPSQIYIHVIVCVCAMPACVCVSSCARSPGGEWRRLCSRWTESDRGGERWSEFLVKAAGQWGRQKLIREAASFTTPQLDQLCVCRQQISWPWQSVKGVFFLWSVCVCVRVCVCTCLSPSTRRRMLPLLSSSVWLAHPNKPHANYHLWKATSSQTSVNWMTICKRHLKRSGCSEAKRV